MPKYQVDYNFDGMGYQIIEAKNEEEARQKFLDGEGELEEGEWGDNYSILEINKAEVR